MYKINFIVDKSNRCKFCLFVFKLQLLAYRDNNDEHILYKSTNLLGIEHYNYELYIMDFNKICAIIRGNAADAL